MKVEPVLSWGSRHRGSSKLRTLQTANSPNTPLQVSFGLRHRRCIPVWVLEQARRLGTSEAELPRVYPTLRAEDLANAWAFVRSHRDESTRQIEANEAD